jgi:metal transporter CNNM
MMDELFLVLVVLGLVVFSAICSGLNVGLMSLSLSDLKVKVKVGNHYARQVLPFRQNTHLALASILLSNIAAVSATSLVLGQRLNGFVAGGISTLLIVVFGEVLPQAYFARYALKFCATLAPLLRLMIMITYPISKPLQLMLDRMFGKTHKGRLNSRRELSVIIGEHLGLSASELDDDEVEIMSSVLMLSEKRVRDIYVPMEKVSWLTPQETIDSKRLRKIQANGWSRLPVFDRKLNTCYGILLLKDLVSIEFSKSVKVIDLPLRPTSTVGSMTALDTLFRKFIGARSHLMPVERKGKIIGIVTIEDLIEEILGHEIEDETDRSVFQPA